MAKKPAKKIAKKVAPKKAAKPMKMAAKKAAPTPVAKARTATKPRNVRTLSYTQGEFLDNLRAFCGLDKRVVARQLSDDIAAFIKDALKRGYKIPLLGLGKLSVRESKARTGRNPATGELIQIPKKKRIRFTVAKAVKQQIL